MFLNRHFCPFGCSVPPIVLEARCSSKVASSPGQQEGSRELVRGKAVRILAFGNVAVSRFDSFLPG